MIKTLIVEDEKIILEDLLDIVDWKAEGFDVVGTAFNGKQGLTKFDKFQPDLVITDIRMPIMDGLDMMRSIRRTNESTMFLILSAYDEFEYAKTALRLGAEDYILKTELSEEYLRDKLSAIRKKLNFLFYEKDYSPVIINAIEFIRGNYPDPKLKIDTIAQAVGLSSGRLSVLFKKEVESTINEYVTKTRIDEAKRLLSTGNYKVYEVSEMVGFKTSQYFSQIFYQATGQYPGSYRKE